MSHPQYHLVKSTTLCATLQASGLPSNLQRDILSGPLSGLGLNNRTIDETQGKKHLCALMDHRIRYTTKYHHLRDLMDTHNIKRGYSGPLFTNNLHALYQYITHSWIAHTYQFIRENNLSM